jgi:hypothetical protein
VHAYPEMEDSLSSKIGAKLVMPTKFLKADFMLEENQDL